jgi:hypothetical protein
VLISAKTGAVTKVYPDMIFVTVSDNYSIVNNVPLKEM